MRLVTIALLTLACSAANAAAAGLDSTKTWLPAGTRVRIEYTNSHDVTVGTLVRGNADTLIVRPEAIQREARFLSRDVHDFAWWYQQPAWKLHEWVHQPLDDVRFLTASGVPAGPPDESTLLP